MSYSEGPARAERAVAWPGESCGPMGLECVRADGLNSGEEICLLTWVSALLQGQNPWLKYGSTEDF